jgi:SAM-dependent methyltransferase
VPFLLLLAGVAVVAGGIASVAGFSIGSLLTPTLALQTGTKLAVAAIAIPHVIGTAQRFWMLRAHVDRRVLVGFGIASAVGGLAGALLHTWVSSRVLTIVFGVVVGMTGVFQLTGWIERVRWGRRAAWLAGLASGALGGLVGNQGAVVEITEADACDLSRWGDGSFDAALSLGPFYHLTEATERLAAARELARVVHPDGLVFVAAMSRLAFLTRTVSPRRAPPPTRLGVGPSLA